MKCKHHPSEDGAGVCASCLRERLLDLIASQSQNEQHCRRRRRPEPSPPPSLAFPRSVSPYVTHRRSDTSLPDRRRLRHIHRFFSTPQVGPTAENGYLDAGRRRAVGSGRFSFFSALFGRRNRSGDTESVRSGSWISSLIRGGRRKKSKLVSAERDARPGRDWGLSPTRDDDSACSSGYATEWSPAGWRRPAQTPMPMRRAATTRGGGGGVFGFAVCLSPLVRASPAGGGRRSGAAEMAGSGEPWALPTTLYRRQASGGVAALAPNRSRKLADFGKFK